MNSFGDYLKGLRKAKSVHLREVGRNIGLSAGFISRLETGKKKDTLPIGKLMEIAEYYGVSKLEMCLAAIVDGCVNECNNTKKQMGAHAIFTIFNEAIKSSNGDCKDCTFYKHNDSLGRGICKECSPTIDRKTGESVFPFVNDDWWCGKYKPL